MTTHLVVGMNGIIGSALYQRLQTQGKTVWGTSYRAESAQQTNVIHLNLADDPVTWNLANTHFDVAYLCAGICRMSLCEQDPISTRKVNIDGMLALARRLAERGTFIIYLSTNQVFSGKESFAKPDALYQPQNEYGRQKAEIETLIKTHCPQSAIVRLTKVVEKNMALVKNWINNLLNQQAIETFHDMPLAPVALRQVLDVLLLVAEKKQPGIYQVSGENDVSYFQLAEYLSKSLNCSASLVQSISALQRGILNSFLPHFTTLDCSSTIALGGDKPPHFSAVLHECFDLPRRN